MGEWGWRDGLVQADVLDLRRRRRVFRGSASPGLLESGSMWPGIGGKRRAVGDRLRPALSGEGVLGVTQLRSEEGGLPTGRVARRVQPDRRCRHSLWFCAWSESTDWAGGAWRRRSRRRALCAGGMRSLEGWARGCEHEGWGTMRRWGGEAQGERRARDRAQGDLGGGVQCLWRVADR